MRAFLFEESLVVANPSAEALAILNPSARLAWDLFTAGQDPAKVAGEISARFGIPRDIVDQDVAKVYHLHRTREFVPPTLDRDNACAGAEEKPPLEQDIQPVSERTYLLSTAPFCIRFRSAEVEAILEPMLGHLEVTGVTAPALIFEVLVDVEGYTLLRDGIQVGRETSPQHLRHVLVFEVAKASFPGAEWLVFLHAAAVSAGGRCIVLPGLPHCGKSTLTAALIQGGFDYLAEDIVPISGELSVAPAPTRLCLREGGWEALCQEFPNLQTRYSRFRWGQRVRYLTPPPIREHPPWSFSVHCLVFPEYAAGAKLQIRKMSGTEVLASLIGTGAWFDDPMDDERLERLLCWVQATPGYHLRYGSLKEAIPSIRDLLN